MDGSYSPFPENCAHSYFFFRGWDSDKLVFFFFVRLGCGSFLDLGCLIFFFSFFRVEEKEFGEKICSLSCISCVSIYLFLNFCLDFLSLPLFFFDLLFVRLPSLSPF